MCAGKVAHHFLRVHSPFFRGSGEDGGRILSADRQIGLVQIRRKRGRIAGYAKPSYPVDVLVCGTNRPQKKYGQRLNGWSFPPAVREMLLQQTEGRTVLHMFGGLADFGARLDLDPALNPDVVGNAWEAEKFFTRSSFDDVILDPPYMQYRLQEIRALLIRAGWIARRYVWWFGTCSIRGSRSLVTSHKWLVDCGEQCAVRTLTRFSVREPKLEPMESDLKRGEGLALKYARWRETRVIQPLFPDLAPVPKATGLLDGKQNRNRVYLGDLA